MTEVVNRCWVKEQLDTLSFVEWDRYTESEVDGEQVLMFFGWIDRDDEYRDFVVLEMWNEDKYVSHTTSSAEYSREISERLCGQTDTHNDCQRVEDEFDVENMVTL